MEAIAGVELLAEERGDSKHVTYYILWGRVGPRKSHLIETAPHRRKRKETPGWRAK